MKDFSKLGPPWVLFSDGGKPVAILAAGRPGEVANVEGWPIETVSDIIQAANAPICRSVEEAMAVLTTKMEAMGCIMPTEEPADAQDKDPKLSGEHSAWEHGYAQGYSDREKTDHDRADVEKSPNPYPTSGGFDALLAEVKRYRAKEAAEVAFLKRPPGDRHESQQLRYFAQVREQIEKELAEGR